MSSGASSAADAATSGAGAPGARPASQPLSVRLIGRGSLAGALVICVVVAAYALLLPGLAEAGAPPPPVAVGIGGGATVTVPDTWTPADSTAGATTFTQGGATLVIGAPEAAERHPAQSLDALIAQWSEEATEGAVATAPRAFDTEAGDSAATVILQEPQQTVQAWVVSNGASEVTVVLTAPLTAWEAASSSAQLLVRSLRFPEETA
ncbi:hypothetical protein Lsed01_02359 [Demequina sediminis]|uniref:Uncharacterized protein n=1 Tax=Demequina sediminis TaxID=1930058 RepID=A0ABP9WMG5_9MICO|nr:hypothetical protein [Demequina sediminis]BDZ62194.1 hypothetical protein GCM10025873_19850 [Demequina sediminis]